MPRTKAKYGWVPDLPDPNDFKLTFGSSVVAASPPSVDMRPQDTPIYNQGQAGSCTGQSTGACMAFVRKKNGLAQFVPSRLFLYYNGRAQEGTTQSDSGASIRDVVQGAVKLGAPPETFWPYSDQLQQVTAKPSADAYTNALQDLITIYQSLVQDLNQLKACLASGFPFVFGFTVYQSFESPQVAQTGIMPMPSGFMDRPVGGHAVMAVGYDDSKQSFIVRNSWGTSWGLQGYFLMPYAYMLSAKLAQDFWVINAVSQTPTPPGPGPGPGPIPPDPNKPPVIILKNITVGGIPGSLVFIPT